MVGEVEPGRFVFGGRAQSEDHLDDHRDDDGRHDRDGKSDADRRELTCDESALVERESAVGTGLGQAVLPGVIGEEEVWVGVSGGEEAGQDGTESSPHSVDPEGVEGVVIAELAFDDADKEVRNHPGENADQHGTAGGDETAGGSDHDQATNDPGAKAEHAGLATVEVFDQRPHEAGSGGCKGGCHEGVRGNAVGGQRGASVEAIPADPEHSGADHAKHHAVGCHLFLGVAVALAQDNAENQGRPAGGHVDHGAAGEVDRGDLGVAVPDTVHQAGATPDHVGHREINHHHPEGDEGHDRIELHALSDSTDDQRRRDDREHQLIHCEYAL